ncbi:alpha-1,4 glucan phosphorylase [Ferrigenium kumadai]|uniref:Alpha-1,4 glucan phosphorylase n=1 Tax=Ferrigenium kumadai TaxID=1682490 RepID=A0AAN1W0E8_9PROT|nr:alpha-glucan family phosphorylase [Ferrigenium kumadai]BBI99576.1 alpha-1,4 glucan phosphorylase [Ferrigenium kumadai]
MEKSTSYVLQVRPKVPARLARLEELANNLWYSWDRPTRALFARLHPGLWKATGQSPKAFLKRVDEQRLADAAEDQVFIANFNRVLADYDTYHAYRQPAGGSNWLHNGDLVAYFCAEFGFHESFPIYSGGLGILAGDHCKAASDLRLPFIGVGLLYRQGYFHQTIDGDGNQIATNSDSHFEDLPIIPAKRADGSEAYTVVDLPGRKLNLKIWQAKVGHITLYLLDTDLESNSPHDRDITHRLYGGDKVMRIEQEIVLGIGGVRALQELGLKPTVWHINEGHAAFLVVERIRQKIVNEGLDFDSSLECVAVNTIFTTHTPVPAGHDHFNEGMVQAYFEHYYPELKLSRDEFLALGRTKDSPDFNMTALALRGTRFHNGVSRIHGDVSANICGDMWPEIEHKENPMTYVTNGVHAPTFLATEWIEVLERHLGLEWSVRMNDVEFWEDVERIPDHLFWSVRQSLKAKMLNMVRERISAQHFRNHGSEAHLDRLLKYVNPENPNILTIGFARRFATYKRATMLFGDLDWLREILNDPERPAVFIFAGKAHPADIPGQDLIRRITQISKMPEFIGKILLVEGYDLALSRKLVSGVDVWLNNPLYPLEASGTSGMKAGINGTINLSVLDGWWGESYDGKNGWAIKPLSESLSEEARTREEMRTLYELLQDQVVPLYYEHSKMGFSQGWVKMAKHSMASIMPRFNSKRMVGEYLAKCYLPASQQHRLFKQNQYENSHAVAEWKARVRHAWTGVTLRRLDSERNEINYGEGLRFEVGIKLNGLKPGDVVVEMLLGLQTKRERLQQLRRYRFESTGTTTDAGEDVFALEIVPEQCGKLEYRIRAYPYHELQTHPFELGMMRWL